MSTSLSRIPHADDMDDAIFENTEGKENWNKAAVEVGDKFKRFGDFLQTLPAYDDEEDDTITDLHDSLQEIVPSYAERLDNEGWETAGKYYILGQVDTNTLIAGARQEMIDWEDVLNAKALMGNGDDIHKIHAAAAKAEVHLDLNEALRWAVEPGDMTEGLYHSGNLETGEALLNLGVLPSYNGGHLFMDVLREGREDIARAFCRAGMDDSSFYLHHWQENARSYLEDNNARQLLREMYWEYGRYQAVDASTLVERKPMKDEGKLRVIFDFAARRVSEIYTAGNHSFKTEVSFDDYGPAALTQARAKLIELGGHPPADEPRHSISKPALKPPGGR
ncbi:MAG: hypothetical protein RBS08_07015 [Bdellovibrionales bacterium]|jgi:hypothetical protein|nr:hypothetical protein [Bdellovibrionales bacterium]